MSVAIEPFAADDLDGVLRLLAEALPQDPISRARFARQVLLDPNFLAAGAPVARRGGEAIGFCLALARQAPLENASPDSDRGYITLLAVHPAHRRRGVGAGLLAAAEAFLRAQGRATVLVSPYAPGYFLPGVDVEAYAGAHAFFLCHGYKEIYRPIAMEAPLWGWQPPEWLGLRAAALQADGVTCEPYHPELTLPLLQFAREEFPGDWARVVREAMGRILLGEPPERLTIAYEAGRVLGFAHWENERFGPIGVAKAARGRGLGHVLMFQALAAMRAQGLRAAWFLWSDDATAARLYHSAGFTVRRRFAVLRKP
jgi:ribosomal protein S18 acetylase RimI-like enzyme